MVDIQAIKDPIEKIALKDQINEFGQCPKQIFIIPHPPRNSTSIQHPISFDDTAEEQEVTGEQLSSGSDKDKEDEPSPLMKQMKKA